jgi:hypothetical protein
VRRLRIRLDCVRMMCKQGKMSVLARQSTNAGADERGKLGLYLWVINRPLCNGWQLLDFCVCVPSEIDALPSITLAVFNQCWPNFIEYRSKAITIYSWRDPQSHRKSCAHLMERLWNGIFPANLNVHNECIESKFPFSGSRTRS